MATQGCGRSGASPCLVFARIAPSRPQWLLIAAPQRRGLAPDENPSQSFITAVLLHKMLEGTRRFGCFQHYSQDLIQVVVSVSKRHSRRKKMYCMAGFLSAASFSNSHEMQRKEAIKYQCKPFHTHLAIRPKCLASL